MSRLTASLFHRSCLAVYPNKLQPPKILQIDQRKQNKEASSVPRNEKLSISINAEDPRNENYAWTGRMDQGDQ